MLLLWACDDGGPRSGDDVANDASMDADADGAMDADTSPPDAFVAADFSAYSEDTRAFCREAFLRCPAAAESRWSGIDRAAQLACAEEISVLPTVDGNVDAGASIDCRLYHLSLIATSNAGCEAAIGDAACVGAPVRPAGFQSSCESTAPLCNEASALGLHSEGSAFGRGVSVVDYDGDGWDDIWRTDSGSVIARYTGSSTMFRNNEGRGFEAVALGFSAESLRGNYVSLFADFDNDGDPDVVHAGMGYDGAGRMYLYRNAVGSVGRYVDATARSGLGDEVQRWWSLSAADFDNDGLLDIAATIASTWVGGAGGPGAGVSGGGGLRIYKNLGDLRFQEVTQQLGFPEITGDVKNAVWFDFDNDRFQDLFVPNLYHMVGVPADGEAPETSGAGLYRNLGGEGFARVSTIPDTAVVTFVASASDVDNDGFLDLYLGRWTLGDAVLHNRGAEGFELITDPSGIDHDPTLQNTMGLFTGDFTGDGKVDVLVGTGSPDFKAPPVFYIAADDASQGWEDATQEIADGHGDARHHGAAITDFDHDGDADLVYNLGGFATVSETQHELAAMYVNRGSDTNKTVSIKLVGTRSNADAVGARIRVTGSRTSHYHVRSIDGFLSQDSRWMTVSLGTANEGSVVIDWPSGVRSTHSVVANERRLIEEPPL